MHVNLSPRQFAEPHLIDLVADALADPDRLCLEVTERALAANPAAAATTLKRLSTLGLTVIAEGVEPPPPAGQARPAGLRLRPGLLFARPDTASRVGELLGHDRRWQ
ncbi:MAG TPA: EAL domain-containing protein [Actinomycetota bacterium]|nr:EAL domain-containing protein [Actinomycetota bacterium]